VFGLLILKPTPNTAMPNVLRIQRTHPDLPWYAARALVDGSYRIAPSSGEWGKWKFRNYRERLGR
jgi:hypothetical protein